MSLSRSYFYHPFQNHFFATYLPQNTSEKNEDYLVFDEVDLYYQPLQDPLFVVIFFLLKSLVVIISEVVAIKVLKLTKKEKSITAEVTKFYLYTLMILSPLRLLFNTTIDSLHPVSEIIGHWFCTVCEYMHLFAMVIILSNSFIACVMRYYFIVHNEKVASYGKQKLKRIFFCLTISNPVLTCIIYALARPELSPNSHFNKCYGDDHKVFLIETSTLEALEQNFLDFEIHEQLGLATDIILLLRKALRILWKTIFTLIGFNVVEGFIYYRIFSHMIR